MTEPLRLRRGDIVWVNCEPSVGAEPKKVRTCVVVSNDVANQFGQVVTVIPTQRFTKERAARAFMVDLRSPRSNLTVERVANASMITSYDRSRVVKRAGSVNRATLERVDAALRLHLGLEEP
ncbi:MAG: type II toxin-antitoxin system PemK/MazF family toxin [Myxococcaceae bacterium]|jgi:mRNA interferase MazF|nr:type II toxin-antitoxin system PemK/MazF family toxin [Myxococcaceae bacterium]